MQVIDEPEAIVEAIFDFYEGARLPADARGAPARCSTCSDDAVRKRDMRSARGRLSDRAAP